LSSGFYRVLTDPYKDGLTSDEQARLKALKRENRELRQANEILRKASAYFAQAELDRRPKP
jgi:transposase